MFPLPSPARPRPSSSNALQRFPLRAVTIPKNLSANFPRNSANPSESAAPPLRRTRSAGGIDRGTALNRASERGLAMSNTITIPTTKPHPPADRPGTHSGLPRDSLFHQSLAPVAPQPRKNQPLPSTHQHHQKYRIYPCESVCICGSFVLLRVPFSPSRPRGSRILRARKKSPS